MVWKDDGWYPPRHCAVRFMMMTGKYFILSLGGDLPVQQKMRDLWDLLGVGYESCLHLLYKGHAMDHTKRFRDYGIFDWL